MPGLSQGVLIIPLYASVPALNEHEIPCYSFSERVQMVRSRDKEGFANNMTEALVGRICRHYGVSVTASTLCHPPGFVAPHRAQLFALDYQNGFFKKMEIFISNGANVKDPRIRAILWRERRVVMITHALLETSVPSKHLHSTN